MQAYGKANWESLWEELEQSGNVGLDFVINPALYPRVASYLVSHPKSLVADFGCGTNMMGIQLLYGDQSSVAALRTIDALDVARFNLLLYIGIEGSEELVRRSNQYLSDIGSPRNIATIQQHVGEDTDQLFDANSVDLCTSRNFLMHLSNKDLAHHLAAVHTLLKSEGQYVFATLNPEYEQRKADHPLQNGERYEFAHGKQGEYGTFYHYYRSEQYFEDLIGELFDVEERVDCLPVTDEYKQSHARYYDQAVPMARVYTLVPKK